MPAANSRPSSLPISRVSAVDPCARHERELVYCERLSATVDVERCEHCEHRIGFVRGRKNGRDQLVCEAPETDAVRATPLALPRLCVSDLMSRNVVCVRPNLSLDALLLLFVENQLQTVPVVDARDHILGMVSEADALLEIQSGRSRGAACAEDIMTPSTLSVPEGTSVTRAAAVMAFERVASLVVVAPTGQVVGVVSASDILHWLGSADGYVLSR